jgi:hypothetical protein
MATTTNYGWTTPDDTALVKDGAAAIRTLGSSVDTTTKNLNPSTTLGDIEYRSSTANTNTRLGIGTTGQILTVAGGVPSWATSSAGGITLLSTTTLSGASTTISSIDQTYTNLYLVGSIIVNANVGLCIRFNGNNTAADYDSYQLSCQIGGSVSLNNQNNGDIGQTDSLTGYATKNYTELSIPQYRVAINKKITSELRYETGGGTKRSFLTQMAFNSTAAITDIGIFPSSGTLSGTVYLYGEK